MDHETVCPQCWRDQAFRSRPQSLRELAASWVRFVPFFCRSCGHRFLTWTDVRTIFGSVLDRREHLRIPVRLRLSFSGGKVRGEGTVIDISLGGCKVKSDGPVAVDDIYYLEIVVSEQEPPIEVPAIVRSVGARGIALKFLRKARENERLLSFIRSQTGSIPSIPSKAVGPYGSGCFSREDSCLIGQSGCDNQSAKREKRYSIK
ncbi:MAG: PilZ domain-containing protein [Nitrospira sp.]|nr:PilZ domain-containing protein [Nitrospira sp.]